MKLGKLQTMWVESLEKHPERQCVHILGQIISGDEYTACCMGELHLCAYRLRGDKLPFNNEGRITDGFPAHSSSELMGSYLDESWEDYGLNDNKGSIIRGTIIIGGHEHDSLADANDCGVTWPEIAKFIRDNPERVFTKSV